MIGRRAFMKAMGFGAAGMLALGSYAVGVEPLMRLNTTRYRLKPANWPEGFRLKLVVLADIHACEPWMPPARVARLCEYANSLGGDMILLLGDYLSHMTLVTDHLPADIVAGALAGLKAPLGVHAVCGNHDWWQDEQAQRLHLKETAMHRELRKVGFSALSNQSIRIDAGGQGLWLAGVEDQLAYLDDDGITGLDDLSRTLAQVTDDAPVIVLAHEPDIFPVVPERVSLTLSGHTHGGQVNLFGWRPIVPSEYGARYVYGHVVEEGRDLIISGGLGCSGLPMRFLQPPEVVVIELG